MGTIYLVKLLVSVWLAGALWFAAQPARAQQAQAAVIEKYCVTCHNDKARTGGLSLQGADLGAVPAHAETWEKVIRKVRTGSMPPLGMPKPDGAALDGDDRDLGPANYGKSIHRRPLSTDQLA